VLLHGVDAVGYMHLTAFPELDLAAQLAERGQAVVVVDRLGYGASGRPPGSGDCLGSQADTTHQVINELRTGGYSIQGRSPMAFDRVALAGHSGGAIVAQVAAYSFPDIDALIVMAFADQGITQNFGIGVARGELPECPFAPDVYRYFFTDQDFAAYALTGVAPAVQSAIERARNPCGDPESFATVLAADDLHLGEIHVPALLMYGAQDALIDPRGAQLQQDRYLGSQDRTTKIYDGGGHTFFLQQHIATQVDDDLAAWLAARGL
jgi:pimeloyl-ACP methyl ester carboxylesterase